MGMVSCSLVLSTRAGADALPFGQIEDLVGPCLHRELYSASANRPQLCPFSWAEGSNCRVLRYCQFSCSPRQQPLKTSCNPSHALPSCRESIGRVCLLLRNALQVLLAKHGDWDAR